MDYVKMPKTERGKKTLAKICDAAEKLFSEKSFYTTEVHDIAAKAGVATGTFYVYFKDKSSVFSYLLDELGRNLRRNIKMAKLEVPDASFVEQERITFRVWFSFVREHFSLFHIVWQSMFIDPESFKKYYDRFSKGYISELERYQESGEIREVDSKIMSYAMMGIYTFAALNDAMGEDPKPDDHTIDELIKFMAHGLLK